jgi:hypothetical protein
MKSQFIALLSHLQQMAFFTCTSHELDYTLNSWESAYQHSVSGTETFASPGLTTLSQLRATFSAVCLGNCA